jgi:tetratricopeptide (TPR) repeat protein
MVSSASGVGNEKIESVEMSNSQQRMAFWLVFVFAGLSLVGVLHHEMWRDELQAWTQARDSSSLADLWQIMRTDPHPMLWPSLLFFLTRITRNPVAMQYLHWLIAVASVYVFVRFSPFTMLQKTLFCFGYYPLFEYCQIARNYSLGMLLLFLFCVLMQRQPRNYIALACVIGLLGTAHFYDVPIAWTLLVVVAVDCVGSLREREYLRNHQRTAVAAILIVALCQVFVAAEARHCASRMPLHLGIHLGEIPSALSSVWRTFCPIPFKNLDRLYWNQDRVADYPQTGQAVAIFLSCLLLIVFLALFWLRSRRAFLMYLLGTMLLLGVQSALTVSSLGDMRHRGKYYLLLLASWWLALRASPVSGLNAWAASLRHRAEQLAKGLITFMLAAHLVAGAICYEVGIRQPFSEAKATVQFLIDHQLADKLIAVSHDASAASISGYLGKKVYGADTGRMQSFPVLDAAYFAQTNRPPEKAMEETVDLLSGTNNHDVVLIVDRQWCTGADENTAQPLRQFEYIQSAWLRPTVRFTELAAFTNCTTDEKFWIYICERVTKPEVSQAGKLEEAVERYEQVLRLKPDDVEAHNNLGLVLAQTGKIAEAIGHWEQALQIEPDYAETHNNLGVALAQTGKIAEAIAHYEQALRLKPDYPEAHNNLGVALAQTGKIAEAIAHYEQALRLKPDYAEAHNNLGLVLAQTGKIAEAIAHYEQALRLKPDFTQARNALARLQAGQ